MRVFLIVDTDGNWQRARVGDQIRAYYDSSLSFTFVAISGDNIIARPDNSNRAMYFRYPPHEFQYGIIVDETDIRIPA